MTNQPCSPKSQETAEVILFTQILSLAGVNEAKLISPKWDIFYFIYGEEIFSLSLGLRCVSNVFCVLYLMRLPDLQGKFKVQTHPAVESVCISISTSAISEL